MVALALALRVLYSAGVLTVETPAPVLAVVPPCSSASFPFSRNGVQSIGLSGPIHSARNATGCWQACCAKPGCAVWQWNPSFHGDAVCYIGGVERLIKGSAGWVGGAKTKAPPRPGPPPPPAPPGPHPPPSTPAPPAASLRFPVDFSHRGSPYHGLGGCSGGGATSRTLYDFPDPQRTQVLDWLFSPGGAMATQLLRGFSAQVGAPGA